MMNGPMKIFSGRSHLDLSQRICHILDVPLGKSHVVRFANENLMVQIDENVRGMTLYSDPARTSS